MRGIAALAIMLCADAPAAAEDRIARGVGTTTCGEFAKEYAKSPEMAELMYFTWAQGFMTSQNLNSMRYNEKLYRSLDISVEEQQATIRSYCNAHPLAYYTSAIMDLYGTLKIKRMD